MEIDSFPKSQNGEISVCRGCLTAKFTVGAILNKLRWTQMYNYCLNLDIKPIPEKPQYLCKECAEKIHQFNSFKQKCLRTNETYVTLFETDSHLKINLTNNKKDKNFKDEPIEIGSDSCDVNVEGFELDAESSLEIVGSNQDNYPKLPDEVEDDKDESDSEGIACDVEVNIKRKQSSDEEWSPDDCADDDDYEEPKQQSKRPKDRAICTHCEKSVLKKNLGSHKEQCQKELWSSSYYCGLCTTTCEDNVMLREHLNEHYVKKELSCQICTFVGRDFAQMITHRFKHQPNDKNTKPCYSCFVCTKKYYGFNVLSLEFHIRKVHLKMKGGYCTSCDKEYAGRRDWMRHRKIHRVDGLICDHCGKKFLYKYEMVNHWNDIMDVKPHICHICGYRSKRITYLKTHIECIHGEHKPVTCHHCGKTYKNEGLLNKHLRRENAEKKFQCGVCSKRFLYKRNFEQHVFFHTNQKPFKCELCPANYKTKSSLSMHMRRHQGDKPHKCDQCNSSFLTKRQLKVHFTVHTGVRFFQCTLCPKAFNATYLLRQHSIKRHDYDPNK